MEPRVKLAKATALNFLRARRLKGNPRLAALDYVECAELLLESGGGLWTGFRNGPKMLVRTIRDELKTRSSNRPELTARSAEIIALILPPRGACAVSSHPILSRPSGTRWITNSDPRFLISRGTPRKETRLFPFSEVEVDCSAFSLFENHQQTTIRRSEDGGHNKNKPCEGDILGWIVSDGNRKFKLFPVRCAPRWSRGDLGRP